MPWVKFLIIFLFISQVGWTNEHEAPPAAEHGGGHEGGAGPATNFSGKQTQQWSEVQTKLSALKSKVEAQENVVKTLMVEKAGAHEGGQSSGGEHGRGGAGGAEDAMAVRIEQLKKEHAKLQALTAEYNKMNLEYETKFPEKGLKESRIYRRLDPQAIQLEEKSSNYEERLQRLQSKIMRQYPKAAQSLKSEKSQKKSQKQIEKSKVAEEKKESPRNGDVTEQIILQK